MAPSLLCWGSVVTMVWGPAKSLGSRSARQQICSKKLLKGISTCPRLSMQTPMFVVWSSKATMPCRAVLCCASCFAVHSLLTVLGAAKEPVSITLVAMYYKAEKEG